MKLTSSSAGNVLSAVYCYAVHQLQYKSQKLPCLTHALLELLLNTWFRKCRSRDSSQRVFFGEVRGGRETVPVSNFDLSPRVRD